LLEMDASDILNIPRGEKPTAAPKIKPPVTKKPDGVSREVFALTKGMPCVVPTTANTYKERRQVGKAVPWRWKDFGNSARSDELRLLHWAKKADLNDDYYFTQYNKTMNIDTYTDEEYGNYFEDNDWTKPETDKLFELCQRLDTRFITVADRLDGRSVEDVKARYYCIARKLLDVRGQYSDEELATMPLFRFQYDKDYDVRRKTQLNSLHNRTPADEAEEAKLIAKLKAVDETLKRDQKLRTRARKQQAETANAGREREAIQEQGPSSPRRDRDRDNLTVTQGRAQREATKRQRVSHPVYHYLQKEKAKPPGPRAVDPDDTTEKKVQRRLEELGVDAWPLPVANVTVAHSDLVDDLTKLVELEQRLRLRASA